MCGVDGMVIDDGTVLRLAEDRFLVLHHHRRRGEDPRLDGGVAADRVAAPAGALHLGHRAVGHLPGGRPAVPRRDRRRLPRRRRRPTRRSRSWPGGTPRSDGVPVRLARISFSGELAYEVYVNPWYAVAVWERLLEAGRAVRHHPVRHRDHARAAGREGLPDHRAGHRRHGHAARPGHGVGGVEEEARLRRQAVLRPRGQPGPAAQAAGRAAAGRPADRAAGGFADRRVLRRRPVARRRRCRCSATSRPATAAPSSSRPFALALVKGGRSRIGETVHVPVNGTLVPVEVTGSVLVDPEGARRDG